MLFFSRPRPEFRKFLRRAFVVAVARPVCSFWLGLNVRHRERLPLTGPVVIIANHNSHLDTLALLSLFPLSSVPDVRPVAAADYFMRNRVAAWCSRRLLGIIPVDRGGTGRRQDGGDILRGCYDALARGQMLLVFPEGTRGDAERFERLKAGIYHIAKRFPEVPVIPVFTQGLGKSMPKGEFIPLPCFVDIYVGPPVEFVDDKRAFMELVREAFSNLQREHGRAAYWEDDPGPVPVCVRPTHATVNNNQTQEG